jgi:hypothetical protein
MKAWFLIIVLSLSTTAFSQIKAKGFYVSMTNDSIWVTFKIPKRKVHEVRDLFGQKIDFSAMKNSVEIIDSLGNVKELTPSDSKGFVFTYDSTVYKMFAKPVDGYNWCFLRPEIMGRKVRLLYYTIHHPGTYSPSGAFGAGISRPAWDEYFWTFEKYDKTYLFIQSRMKEREMVPLLKTYFSDKPEIQELIDKKFQGLTLENTSKIIKSIVEAYNAN